MRLPAVLIRGKNRLVLVAICVLLAEGLQAQIPQTPEKLDWCGVELTLTPAARAKVQAYVDRLHVKPAYFQSMATKAAIFLPHIQNGLAQAGVPQDLQYIIIQESGLKGDAVSTSNAVGFWQFKDFTAREVGLLVDGPVDERKHISRSTAGAARYFYRNNLWFNNWVYATIAYMTGPTGALPYVDPQQYGAKQMTVDGDLHWYAIKSIAYKVAFQDALEEIEPPVMLEAHSAGRELVLSDICKNYGLTAEEVRAYNLWFTGWRIKSERPITYFIPRKGTKKFAGDPHLDQLFPALDANPQYAYARPPDKPKPVDAAPAVSTHTTAGNKPLPKRADSYQYLPLAKEPLLDKEFTYVRTGELLPQLAARTQVKISKLARWNDFGRDDALAEGTPVLLVAPRKAQIHVALGIETLSQVANWYEERVEKLAVYNDIQDANAVLPKGRKLYLRQSQPSGQLAVIYQWEQPKPKLAQAVKPEQSVTVKPAADVQAVPVPPARAEIIASAKVPPATPKPAADTAPKPHPNLRKEYAPVQQAPKPQPPAKDSAVAGDGAGQASYFSTPLYQLYRVGQGDTMYGIARKFGMSLDELRKVNGLSTSDEAVSDLAVGAALLVRSEP